jgi:hypothetical protein
LHIEFLVEELSAQEFLFQVLPQILTTNITYDIHAFRGKTAGMAAGVVSLISELST